MCLLSTTCMRLDAHAWLRPRLGFALSVLSRMTTRMLKSCSLGFPSGSFQTLFSSDVLYVEEHDSGGSNTPETEEFVEVSKPGSALPAPLRPCAIHPSFSHRHKSRSHLLRFCPCLLFPLLLSQPKQPGSCWASPQTYIEFGQTFILAQG